MTYREVMKAILSGFQQFSMLDLLDILIIAFLIYKLIIWTRNTRAYSVLKGIGVLFLCSVLSTVLSLNTVSWLFDAIFRSGSIIIVLLILFQQEIRRMLERIGGKWNSPSGMASAELVLDLHSAIMRLAKAKTGALIVVEQKNVLNDIISTGKRIDGILSGALLVNIFEKNTPLHDGAVVTRGTTLVAAACILPLSDDMTISPLLGTRHRAALGVSTEYDCITIVVSEETGGISVAQNGHLTEHIDSRALCDWLCKLYIDQDDKAAMEWVRKQLKERWV